jgi:hypothetical protein
MVKFLEFKKLESEAEDWPQVRVKVTFPLETVMTLTKVTEATTDKVRFLRVLEVRFRFFKLIPPVLDTLKDMIFDFWKRFVGCGNRYVKKVRFVGIRQHESLNLQK